MKHFSVVLALACFCYIQAAAQGRTGVNTTNPQETLDVHEAQSSDTRTGIRLHTPTLSDTSAIILSNGSSPSNFSKYTIGSSNKKMFIASKTNSGSVDTVMLIDEEGEVYLRNLSILGAGQVMSDADGKLYSQEPPPPPSGGGGGTGIVCVPGTAGHTTNPDYTIDLVQNFSYIDGGDDFFIVPFDVPEGSTINSIHYFLFDGNSAVTVKAELMERWFQNPTPSAIAGYTALTAAGINYSVQEIIKSGSFQVDKTENHYFIKVSILNGNNWPTNGTAGFFGARINYTAP